jgi:hypothetical protein
MTEPSFPDRSHGRSGGVRAGRDLKAENVVTGVQVQGADAETARQLLALVPRLDSGSVEAVQDLIATNVITGLQYLGQGGTEPNREQFQRELAALREQLTQAIAAGEIAEPYDAEDAHKAVERAVEQSQAPEASAGKIAPHLERAATIITRAATVAESAGKFQAAIIKLAPVAMALKKLVGLFF